jgi:two-component system LytT family response regulator
VIKSILVDNTKDDICFLGTMLSNDYPDIHIYKTASTLWEADGYIQKFSPKLVFMNIQLPLNNGYNLNEYFSDTDYQLIFRTNEEVYNFDAINCSAYGYLSENFNLKEHGTNH